jgi:YVTN family beta-propeller protein
VANQFSSNVSVIDTASNSTIVNIPVGFEPTGIGVTPDGSHIYVADSVLNVVWVIDAPTNEVLSGSIPVGGNPQDLLMSRDGSKVYVSNFNSQSVSVIDTASNTVHATISVGFFPLGMDTSPDGKRLYVVDGDPALNNGSVAVVDTETNSLLTRVNLPPFHTPRHVAITPDGGRGYVTINLPQQVLVFDTGTNVVVGNPIVLDGIPEGIAITQLPAASPTLFAQLESTLNVRPNSRYPFSAVGSFSLSERSDGIQPQLEIVRVSIAGSSGVLLDETLAAGSFQSIGRGGAIFHAAGNRSGIQLMRITAGQVPGAYGFETLAGVAAVSSSGESSVTLSLQIGNDGGAVELKCTRRGSWACR